MTSNNKTKKIFRNKFILNISLIIGTSIVLIVLVLSLLRVYTRHGQNIVVPDLQGLQVDEAGSLLRSKGLKAEVVDSIYKIGAIPGAVLEQVPKASNKVKKGRAIFLSIYSQSPQQIAVPELVDFSERQAIALLNSLGFSQIETVETISEYSGLVISVEYKGRRLVAEEKIPAGSPIRLIVGSNTIHDSLSISNEYIVSPDIPQISPEKTSKTEVEQSNIDESFF